MAKLFDNEAIPEHLHKYIGPLNNENRALLDQVYI